MNIIIIPKYKEKKHHKLIKEACVFFAEKLLKKKDLDKIDTIYIRLAGSIDYGESRGDCKDLVYPDGKLDFIIRLDASTPLPDMISTLAHEMVHAKQSVVGELEDNGKWWVWKGKKMKWKKSWYTLSSAKQSAILPWEKEAYEREVPLATEFFRNYLKD